VAPVTAPPAPLAALAAAVAAGSAVRPRLLAAARCRHLSRNGRRAPRHRAGAPAATVAAEIPDVIDLLSVAVTAGLNVRLAVEAVAERAPPGPLAKALASAAAEARRGDRLADALGDLPADLGEGVRPLAAALVDAERYGTPLGPTLDRLAADARRLRQRRAEEAARKVPVKLLLPLVTCILPAFGLLTVAPLIAGALAALRR